ncbi:hypothetical protein [Cellulomonas sp. PhB143]|uniref:hypothetical protein n=1 Tax=Cellulomonas sp. PhB143 TaxID=2485186 RepID=UPI000F47387E|nr:hypothetical protein [Cellulomonas sp. PhB143]
MNSSAGLVAVALVVLWLAYLVPARVQHRQQLLDSRLGDRFSGTLRVLAVAGATDGTGARARRALSAPGAGGSPALGAAEPLLMIGDRTEGGAMGDQDVERAGGRVPDVVPVPAGADPRGGRGPREARLPSPSPARLAMLERRSAAARRRAALSLVLLLCTVAAWVAVGAGALLWAVALVPTALLAGVLVLGRNAAAAARQADEVWLAEHRARHAARVARGLSGAPAAPRGHRVTGRAVHASHVTTQMIPRVASPVAAGERLRDEAHDDPRGADATRTETIATAEARRAADDVRRETERAESEPVAAKPAGSAAPEPETAVADDLGRAWNPVPVPRPTYTMKPAAPRREPAPLPETGAAPRVAEAAPAPAPADVPEAPAVGATAEAARATSGGESHPRTDTLGLNLNEILARRRASGQ